MKLAIYHYSDYCMLTEALRKKENEDLTAYKNINLDDGYTVTPTFHLDDARSGDNVARKYSLTEPSIKRILNKALKHGLKDVTQAEGHLIMKNPDGRWDDFIVVKTSKHLVLKSIILQNRNQPTYFVRDNDFKLVIEKHGFFDFILVEANISADKYFEQSKLVRMMKPAYKARDILIEMSIKDFLNMADKLDTPEQDKLEGITTFIEDTHGKLTEIPFLTVSINGNQATVTGHEGRHRATYFKSKGCTTMPVKIISTDTRWSEQNDPKSFDYHVTFPKVLKGENGHSISFPFTREDLDG